MKEATTKEKEEEKDKKKYTQIGDKIKIVETKETFSEKIVPVDYFLRRGRQLEEVIERAREELQEINEILRGVK